MGIDDEDLAVLDCDAVRIVHSGSYYRGIGTVQLDSDHHTLVPPIRVVEIAADI